MNNKVKKWPGKLENITFRNKNIHLLNLKTANG